MNLKTPGILNPSITSCCMTLSANSFFQNMGIFEGQTDVGKVLLGANVLHNTILACRFAALTGVKMVR